MVGVNLVEDYRKQNFNHIEGETVVFLQTVDGSLTFY